MQTLCINYSSSRPVYSRFIKRDGSRSSLYRVNRVFVSLSSGALFVELLRPCRGSFFKPFDQCSFEEVL